jgi:Na+/melibiose symporter-like transporter
MAADPLILPSLLTNRGFTSGLLLGLAFFAAVNGLAYVIPLFLQTALGMKRSAAAIALSPVMIGIIVSSIVCRPLVATLGRGLVVTGLGIRLAGAAGLWATVWPIAQHSTSNLCKLLVESGKVGTWNPPAATRTPRRRLSG